MKNKKIKNKIIKEMHNIYNESLNQKSYLCICQPRRDEKETPAQKFDGYEGVHIDLSCYSRTFMNFCGEKVDLARHYLLEEALKINPKYILFAGEDTVLPYDGFSKLHETSQKHPDAAIIGVYYIKISNPMVMVKEDGYVFPANVDPEGSPFEVWQAGMDCMLIPAAILRKMKESDPELPFCCIGHPKIPGLENLPFIGEDNFFYHRLRQCGFTVMCDPRVQCLHIDLLTGKYTAHPSVNLGNYYTNIPITTPLGLEDKSFIDKRWVDRIPKTYEENKHGS